jgi:hypothetical protein
MYIEKKERKKEISYKESILKRIGSYDGIQRYMGGVGDRGKGI